MKAWAVCQGRRVLCLPDAPEPRIYYWKSAAEAEMTSSGLKGMSNVSVRRVDIRVLPLSNRRRPNGWCRAID